PDEDFVSAIFLNVFGRAVQAGGLAYWAGELAAKSRGQLVLDMTTSALTTADGTDGKAYFNNRVDVSKYAVTRQTASAVSRSVSETTAVLSGVDGDAGGVVGAVDVVVGW
ncbi:MAG: DUF4214 domain-containing protein, partial [Gallionella sp.]|nr:DUF4214 domain-containing protein [Gallionella sp.]